MIFLWACFIKWPVCDGLWRDNSREDRDILLDLNLHYGVVAHFKVSV